MQAFKYIFLINPISGTKKKENFSQKIAQTCKERNVHFEILPTSLTGNYDYVIEKINEDAITHVVIVGGDGTVNQILNALQNCKVVFGIIPAGSGNGLALAAGIPKNLAESIETIFDGSIIEIDTFTVNNQFSCLLSGLGFDATVAHNFAKNTTRGLFTYTKESIIQYFKARPYTFSLQIDGIPLYIEAFFISIANSNQFGNNVTIAPKANLSDGLLDIVIVQKMNKLKLPFALIKQIRGNNKLQQLVEDMQTKNIIYLQSAKLTIENPMYAPLHIDGDPKQTAEKIDIAVRPNTVQLICPNK